MKPNTRPVQTCRPKKPAPRKARQPRKAAPRRTEPSVRDLGYYVPGYYP